MNILEKYVTWWVEQQEPAELEGWAKGGVDLMPRLRKEYGRYLRMARSFVGQKGMDEIAAMGDRDADRLISHLLRQAPAHGVVCWRHGAWFRRQVAEARKLFLRAQGAPA